MTAGVPRRRPIARRVAAGAGIALVVAIAVLLAIGWHYATLMLGPDAGATYDEQIARAVTDSTVTLSGDVDARTPGVWAIEWRGGYGDLGPIVRADTAGIVRRWRPVRGRLRPGTPVDVGPYPTAADPAALDALAFTNVTFPAPTGAGRAWLVPGGAGADWMIFVHGRGAERAQSVRLLPLFHRLGWTSLVIAYRNHDQLPLEGDGRYRLGGEEWRTVASAVRWARARGARRIVLVGYSMGGGIALEFLRHAPEAAHVAGAVLDSPVLDWRAVFDVAARERHVPPPITALGMWVTERRTGLSFADLDQVAHARELRVPVLVLHGREDPTVPFAASAALAKLRPDRVTLVAFHARHVRGWNVDPPRYEAAIADWLGRLR